MTKREKPGRIAKDANLSREKQIEMAKALQEQGHPVSKIAYIMRIDESTVRPLLVNVKENIWYPGEDYEPRTDEQYDTKLAMLEPGEIVFLVRKRVNKDLQVGVENGYLGEENETMRVVMLSSASHKNIMIVLHGVARDDKQDEYTVDWVCREMGVNSRKLIP